MTTVAIIQARHTSTRLPGKTTLPLAGVSVIQHIIGRLRHVRAVNKIAVAIPLGEAQAPLRNDVRRLHDVVLVEGPDDDLARRFTLAVDATQATTVLRVWADCPAIEPALADAVLRRLRETNTALVNIPGDSGWPEGTECHAWTADAFRTIDREATAPFDREALMPFIERDPSRFPVEQMRRPGTTSESPIKMLLDTPQDYFRLGAVFGALYPRDPQFDIARIEKFHAERPDLF